MINIETKIKNMLEENGMWGKSVDAVMSKAKEAIPDMKNRWGDDINDYFNPLVAFIWGITKNIALEWIDENLPEAWYRPMFVNTTPRPMETEE